MIALWLSASVAVAQPRINEDAIVRLKCVFDDAVEFGYGVWIDKNGYLLTAQHVVYHKGKRAKRIVPIGTRHSQPLINDRIKNNEGAWRFRWEAPKRDLAVLQLVNKAGSPTRDLPYVTVSPNAGPVGGATREVVSWLDMSGITPIVDEHKGTWSSSTEPRGLVCPKGALTVGCQLVPFAEEFDVFIVREPISPGQSGSPMLNAKGQVVALSDMALFGNLALTVGVTNVPAPSSLDGKRSPNQGGPQYSESYRKRFRDQEPTKSPTVSQFGSLTLCEEGGTLLRRGERLMGLSRSVIAEGVLTDAFDENIVVQINQAEVAVRNAARQVAHGTACGPERDEVPSATEQFLRALAEARRLGSVSTLLALTRAAYFEPPTQVVQYSAEADCAAVTEGQWAAGPDGVARPPFEALVACLELQRFKPCDAIERLDDADLLKGEACSSDSRRAWRQAVALASEDPTGIEQSTRAQWYLDLGESDFIDATATLSYAAGAPAEQVALRQKLLAADAGAPEMYGLAYTPTDRVSAHFPPFVSLEQVGRLRLDTAGPGQVDTDRELAQLAVVRTWRQVEALVYDQNLTFQGAPVE